jgi:hypothetical protein
VVIAARVDMENPIMSAKADNDNNFEKYQKRFLSIQTEHLLPPPDLPPDKLISFLAAEGMKLLEAEERAIKKPKVRNTNEQTKLDTVLGMISKNPYIRARHMILEKMSLARKKELEDMEKSGNTDNKKYQDFIKEVAKLGDSLSQK